MTERYLDQIKNIFSESNKTKIAIIGKGNSLQGIDLHNLRKDYFVVALNDAEVFLPVDVSILYRSELVESIEKNGVQSDYYIAPSDLKLPTNKLLPTKYVSLNQEGLERIYSFFYGDEFYILDFTLLSAIKLAMIFQQTKKIAVDILFLGFDFYIDFVKENDFQGLEYRNAHLKTQESIFVTLIKDLQIKNPLLHFQHIGNKKYSSQSVEEFNQSLQKTVFSSKNLPTNSEIYTRLLQEFDRSENKVLVVAEFTNNHIGDKNRLIKMIELAADAGADMIKVQKRDVASFYSDAELNSPYASPFGNTLKAYREAVELSDELFATLDVECRKRNIPWFVSVLDWNSYLYVKQLDCPIIKLPSTISNHRDYLRQVAQDFDGELVVSTGFTDVEYEKFVFENLMNDKHFFLLQCTSSYPTPPEGCQIAVVRHYEQLRKEYPNIVSGYSSHDLGSMGCMMAVAAGARMIEKHVKLGDLSWIHFDSVAIDLYNNQFKKFVNDIRKAEAMCGTTKKKVHSFEHHKYKVNTNENN